MRGHACVCVRVSKLPWSGCADLCPVGPRARNGEAEASGVGLTARSRETTGMRGDREGTARWYACLVVRNMNYEDLAVMNFA